MTVDEAEAETTRLSLHDVSLALPRDLMVGQVAEHLRAGHYERNEASVLKSLVEPEDVILELGAGVGLLSTIAARTARKVYAYEANPALIPVIAATHRLNNVECDVRNAVVLPRADTPTAAFFIRKQFWASSLSPEPQNNAREVSVPVEAFAAVKSRTGANFLLVDIEGGESELFRDIDLSGIGKILLEVHPRRIGLKGVKTLFDFLSSQGMAYDCRNSRGQTVTFRRA